MKLTIRLSFLLAAAIFLFGASQASAQQLNEILKRMEDHRATLKTVRAEVSMAKYNAQLDEVDKTSGKTMYLPGGKNQMYVRIDWTKPVEESISIIKGEYTIYRPRLNQVVKGKVDQASGKAKANNALAFMNMSKDELKKNYTVQWMGEEKIDGSFTARIKLLPKNASAFKFAELWVDGDGMPLQGRVTEKNNDHTTIRLSNIEKNITLNGSLFALVIPKDAKVVKG